MSKFKKNVPPSHLAIFGICRKFSLIIIATALLQTVKSSPSDSDEDIDMDRVWREAFSMTFCATIHTAAGDKVTLREGTAIPQKMFEMIHVKKLKNALFEPNTDRNCAIQVCGFTSFGKRKNDNYIGTDDDFAGCLMIDSNTNASKVLYFNDEFNVSSIKCGCHAGKRNCTTSCETKSVHSWSENECARLYQEKNCSTCHLDPIRLSNRENYTTSKTHHVVSMVVKDKCEVHFRSPSFKKMYRYKDVTQPIIYKSGPINEDKVVSAYQSEPEYFECVCDYTLPTPTPKVKPYPVTIVAIVGYAVGGVGLFSAAVLIFTGIVMWKRGKVCSKATILANIGSQETITTIAENEEDPAAVYDENVGVDNDIVHNHNIPFSIAFETFPELFEVQEVIGHGHFGQVSIGALKVAIKTVKADISSTDRATCIKSLEQEIKILSHLGSHPNVVRFQNAYIGDCMNGEIFLILELCQGGSLESHLKSIVTPRIQEILCQRELERMRCAMEVDDYPKDTPSVDLALPNPDIDTKNDLEKLDPVTLWQFYKWLWQITCGMMHIQSKNIVHVDLATRNVLLTSNLVAKIADFGLAKKVYIKNYASSKTDSLPIRWVAPECLTKKKCTSKSDVWSFGVTAWEVFNLGKVPYEDLDCAQVVASIIEGGRLDCPQYATDDVYSKLMDCWSECPDGRPSFESLQKYFDCKMQEVLLSV